MTEAPLTTETLVTYERDESGVAWITLNRPDKKNAMNALLLKQLQETYETYANDEDARCAVVRGAGDAFCTGGDITMFPSINSEVGLRFTLEDGQPHYRFLDSLNKPVIAAVHGYCLAGGFELALQSTFIVAAKNATFGMEEARLGLIPGHGGTTRLLSSIPSRTAAELLLTARRIDADEAYRLGVVNTVVEDADALTAHVSELATKIASMSPNSVAAVLHVLRELRAPLAAAFDVEALRTAILFGNSDTQKRIQGVLDRLKNR